MLDDLFHGDLYGICSAMFVSLAAVVVCKCDPDPEISMCTLHKFSVVLNHQSALATPIELSPS